LLLLIIGLFLHYPAFAEENVDEVYVVTGTKTDRLLQDSPVRIEVVTAEELASNHARDLAEALQYVPGLTLKRIHGKSGEEVWLQGLDADRVLILIDGKPVSASTGASVDVSQISVADVDHIEIVKGAVSALYGSEAMGGVVNVITKQPTQGNRYKITLDSGSYGDQNVGDTPFNNNHASVFVSHNSGTWFAQLMADARYNQGTDLDQDTWEFEGDAGSKSNIAGEIGYRFKNGAEVAIAPSFYYEDLNKNFSTYTPGVGDIEKEKLEVVKRKTLSLNAHVPIFTKGELSAWYIYENFTDNTDQNTLSTDYVELSRYGESEFNKGEIQLDLPVGETQLVTVGMISLQNSLMQTQVARTADSTTLSDELDGKQTRSGTEVYLQNDIFIGDQLEILPGVRYQYDSDFGENIAPKINVMYRPSWGDPFTFRGGIGSGYRVPTLKERHYVFDHSTYGYMVLGNADLTPETSHSVQIGGELQINKAFTADINFFYNDIKNLISTQLNDSESASTGLSIYEYTNVGEARTQGVDVTSTYALTPHLSANVAYTYLDAKNLETGKQLTFRPAHQIKFNIDYTLPAIDSQFSVFLNYQSKEFVDEDNLTDSPAYSTLDAKINTDINDRIKVFIGVDNLTDSTRDIPLTGTDYRPESGRFIYMGMTFTG